MILGAGLDSFAWRHPELSVSIQVVEIDHPASQKWKRMRLREIGLAEPPNLVFIPLDFETQTLLDGLRHVGIGQEPDFFCWLGVTQYLSRKSVLETLERMSGMPSGTELAFTLIVPPELLNPEDRRFSVIAAKAAADRVEP